MSSDFMNKNTLVMPTYNRKVPKDAKIYFRTLTF